MEVKHFTLHNVGRFSKLEIPLAPLENHQGNVTVLVGNNGSGKTSILKSLATSLSWLVARIKTENGNGNSIPELVIKNGKTSAAVEIKAIDEQRSQQQADSQNSGYSWIVAKARQGRKGEFKSDYTGATALADHYRTQLSQNEETPLPLIAFYSVERVVIDIPLKIKNKHSFLQLDGYDKSLSQGVDFRRFFEWFREREDTENEATLSDAAVDALRSFFGEDSETWEKFKKANTEGKDKQLTAVREAIYQFMPGFENLRVKRKPRLHMAVDKNGDTFNVAQLSQGEKSLMALIGDIARRLAVMNPNLENPLTGDVIVLIDEVDMHLHPKWQRSVIKQLTHTFPNCQFVLTTHSPLVISDSKNVLAYLVDESKDELKPLPPLFGEDANTVLLEVMDTDIRNEEINTQLNNLLDAIHDADLTKAKSLLQTLTAELPERNLELAKARLLLRKKELRVAKNN